MSGVLSPKWPHVGPSFNTWFVNLDTFMTLLNSVKDEHWWIVDTDLKYINLRIDTRDNSFVLYLTGHAAESVVEYIDPHRVADAILKYNTEYRSKKNARRS